MQRSLYSFKLLEILTSATKANPISQSEIARIMTEEGCPIERKAVSRRLKALIDEGHKINITAQGCYLDAEKKNYARRCLVDVLASIENVPEDFLHEITDLVGGNKTVTDEMREYWNKSKKTNHHATPAFRINIKNLYEAIENEKTVRVNTKTESYVGIPKWVSVVHNHLVFALLCNREEKIVDMADVKGLIGIV